VIPFFTVHSQRPAVIRLGRVKARKIQRIFPLLLKTEPEKSNFAFAPTSAVAMACTFLWPKLPPETVRLAGPARWGDLVMMLMVANSPLLPYRAEEGRE
jgi:hypothetical protein